MTDATHGWLDNQHRSAVRRDDDGTIRYFVGVTATARDGWAELPPELLRRATWGETADEARERESDDYTAHEVARADREFGLPPLPLARAITDHLGLTHAEIARRVGIHPNDWGRYVRGVVNPGADKIEAWCDALGLSVAYEGRRWVVR